MKPLLTLGLAFLFCLSNFAQTNHFEFKGSKDIALSAAAGVTLLTGLVLKSRVEGGTISDISQLNINDINGIDRIVFNHNPKNKGLLSDVLVGGLALTPSIFLFSKKCRNDLLPIVAIYAQTLAFTSGITGLSKAAFKRYRPYAYSNTVGLEDRISSDARQSFFSGHTANAAALSFTTASILTTYLENEHMIYGIWCAAAIVPAYVGYLRIASYNHFPTDILAGYALGAGIGLLTTHLHKTKALNTIELETSLSRIYLIYRF